MKWNSDAPSVNFLDEKGNELMPVKQRTGGDALLQEQKCL